VAAVVRKSPKIPCEKLTNGESKDDAVNEKVFSRVSQRNLLNLPTQKKNGRYYIIPILESNNNLKKNVTS